eukprot:gene3448-1809_t
MPLRSSCAQQHSAASFQQQRVVRAPLSCATYRSLNVLRPAVRRGSNGAAAISAGVGGRPFLIAAGFA